MKIEDYRQENNMDMFKLLEMGDVFETDTGIYIKCSIADKGINAVNLKNGAPALFIQSTNVRPLSAKVIVEGEVYVDKDF